MCYNLFAVEGTPIPEPARNIADSAERAQIFGEGQRAVEAAPAEPEHPMRYCPVCSQHLEPRRCKLICTQCGYFMSCADYY
jgi:hypothetical protein